MARTMTPAAGQAPSAAAHPAGATTPEQVAELLQDVAPLLTRRIREEMRYASTDSLTVPQLRALLYVRRNPGTPLSPLADHLGVGMTTASGLVERLVRQDLLTRVQDPAERRRIQLELTTVGAARVQRSRRLTGVALAGLLGSLTAAQLSGIERALGDLRQAFLAASAQAEPR